MTVSLRAILALCAGLASAPALAQSEQELIDAFSGQWYVFDAAMRSGGQACSLMLDAKRQGNTLTATPSECAAPVAQVDGWSIRDGRIILEGAGAEIAVMGGNQFRVTGEMPADGRALVVERAQGDGSSARMAEAIRKHRCYYVGFTADCAKTGDLTPPAVDAETGFAIVETVATLNVRGQPRRDAPVVGTIPAGTKVRVNQCLVASDGPWCRARFGEESVWMAMTALRQDEWPVVTYRAASDDPA